MKKSILKIAALSLIIGLNWAGLLAIGRTFAYFNDTENSPENIYQAGTLDFVIETPGDFSLNFKADETAVRDINVINEGSLLFKYIAEGADFSGPLCETLYLEARLNGETKYDGALTSFVLVPPVIFSEPSNWEFIFSFSGNIETYKNTPCQFFLDFKAWQDNIESYPSGFSDIERALVHLTLRQEKTVVLNEFLPNPEEDECGREGILGEWVEIYNNGDIEMDLYGWYIEDAGAVHKIVIDDSNTLSGSTVIGTKGSGSEWLVVFLNDCILNNDDGDTVSLYHSSGSLVDSYSYSGSALEDKSYARYPDGTGPWYDPIPTPGGPNVLDNLDNKDDITFSELVEEFMDSNGGTGDLIEELVIIEPEIETPEPIIETTTPSTEETVVIQEESEKEEEPVVEEELIEELTPEEVIIEDPQLEPLKEPEPEPEPELNNNDGEENV